MYILDYGADPEMLNILITGNTYSAVISILYILLHSEDIEDIENIQTLFDNSKIMEHILFNEDLEDLLAKGLNPNIICTLTSFWVKKLSDYGAIQTNNENVS